MRGILILQSPSKTGLVVGVVQMPKMKQKRDHFVLILSREAGQLLFDF